MTGAAEAREKRRLAQLEALDILDSGPEPGFDDLVEIAGQISGMPMSLIGLIDSERQWFKAKIGTDLCSAARDETMCNQVVREEREIEVPDARLDPRFADNPNVAVEGGVVFYAGFPLLLDDGTVPGTLCVVGFEPHQLSEKQKSALRAVARQVVSLLQLRVSNADQAREIELRREAETALASSRDEFEQLTEQSRDPVLRWGVDGIISYVNRAVTTVLGYIPEQVIGQSAMSLVHPDERREFLIARDQAAAGSPQVQTVRGLHADGTWRWFELTLAPTATVSSEGADVRASARDVTARVEAAVALAVSEEQFRGVYYDSPVGIALVDEESMLVEVNPALCRLLGREEDQLVGRRADFLVPADANAATAEADFQTIDRIGEILHMDGRFTRRGGEIRFTSISLARIRGPQGKMWSLAHVQDITDRKRIERELADSEHNLAAIGQVVRRIQTGTDPRQTIVDAAQEIAGTHSASLIEAAGPGRLAVTASSGIGLTGTVFSLDEPTVTREVWNSGEGLFLSDPHQHPMVNRYLLAASGARSMLWQPIKTNGEVRAILAVFWEQRVPDVTDRWARVVSLLADEAAIALEHDALLRRYEELATTDQLTSLPNRRSWNERLPVLMAQAQRDGRPLSVAIADLDFFKKYNDTFGHPEGDALLVELGEALRRELRTVDVVARWGGEEFAIALPNCSTEDAIVVLNRIRAAVPRGQTLSIGVSDWTRGATEAGLLTRADQALYAAKRTGRDRIVVAPVEAGADVIPAPRAGEAVDEPVRQP